MATLRNFDRLMDNLTKALGGVGEAERRNNDMLAAMQRQQQFEKYREWDDARYAARYISPMAQNIDTFIAEGGSIPQYFEAQMRAIQYDPEFQGMSPERKRAVWSAMRQGAQPYIQAAVNRGDLLEANTIQTALGLGRTTSDLALGLIAQDPVRLAAGQEQRGMTVQQNADGTYSTLNRLTGETTSQGQLYNNVRVGNVQNPQMTTPWGIEQAGSEGAYRLNTRALNDQFTQEQRANYRDDRAYAQAQRDIANARAEQQHAMTLQVLDSLRNQGMITQEAYAAGLQQSIPTTAQVAQGAPVPQIGGGTMDGSVPVRQSTTVAPVAAPAQPSNPAAAMQYLSTHLASVNPQNASAAAAGQAAGQAAANAIFNMGDYANLTPAQRQQMITPVPIWEQQLRMYGR